MQPSTVLAALAWLVGMGLAYAWFDGYLEDRRNPNRDPQVVGGDGGVVRIVLQRNAHNAYVLSGRINGHTVTFLVDTGASAVAVPLHPGLRLGMPRGAEIQVGTANGPSRAWLSRIDVLQIGSLQLRDVRAYLAPGLSGDEVLLGMSALRQLNFHQEGDRLILEYDPGAS